MNTTCSKSDTAYSTVTFEGTLVEFYIPHTKLSIKKFERVTSSESRELRFTLKPNFPVIQASLTVSRGAPCATREVVDDTRNSTTHAAGVGWIVTSVISLERADFISNWLQYFYSGNVAETERRLAHNLQPYANAAVTKAVMIEVTRLIFHGINSHHWARR